MRVQRYRVNRTGATAATVDELTRREVTRDVPQGHLSLGMVLTLIKNTAAPPPDCRHLCQSARCQHCYDQPQQFPSQLRRRQRKRSHVASCAVAVAGAITPTILADLAPIGLPSRGQNRLSKVVNFRIDSERHVKADHISVSSPGRAEGPGAHGNPHRSWDCTACLSWEHDCGAEDARTKPLSCCTHRTR